MKAIVHIGMHKTGTSSIQDSFSAFAPDGFQYLNAPIGTNLNGWLRLLFEGDAEVRQLLPLRKASLAEIDRMRADWRDATDRDVASAKEMGLPMILSAERFTYLAPTALDAFAQWAEATFEDVQIVAYVRDPIGFVKSAFQQRMKSGAGDISFDQDLPHYRKRFEKFEQTFGVDRVQYRNFRRNTLLEGDAVRDFAAWIGGAYPADRVINTNESISVQALSALMAFFHAHPEGSAVREDPQAAQKLVRLLQGFGKGGFSLSDRVTADILDDIAADCDWMDARLPEPLDRDERQAGQVMVESAEDLIALAPTWAEELRSHIAGALVPTSPERPRDLLPALNFVRYMP